MRTRCVQWPLQWEPISSSGVWSCDIPPTGLFVLNPMVINTGHICNQEEHSCDRAVNQGNSELWFGNQTRKPCHETWVCAPSECSSGASTFHMKRNHWWTLSLLFSLFISLPSTLQIELIIKASVSIVINRKKKQNKLDKISETNAKRKQQTSKTFTHRNHPAPQWLVSQSRV